MGPAVPVALAWISLTEADVAAYEAVWAAAPKHRKSFASAPADWWEILPLWIGEH